jgi:galactose mutarotase-like enzyme
MAFLLHINYNNFMTITLANDQFQVAIKTKGAELCSLINKDNHLEHIWSGDASIWGKTSPVLFPIVGTLKDNTFIYMDKNYKLSRHGFARDAEFEIIEHAKKHVVFLLKDTIDSFKNYPFTFELTLKYELDSSFLKVTYKVKNTGTENMYFSIGAHPAFKVPFIEGTNYEDYYLEFELPENADRWPISKNGLIENIPTIFFNNSNHIDLTRTLFQNDALVFKDLYSNKVSLKTDRHTHGLDFYFEGFPYLGLWAAKNGDFVCIEPWCGIADSVDHHQQIINKEGIEILPAKNSWLRQWKVRCF